MPRALHVVVTGNFAGAERYVATLARNLPAVGWDAVVVGGDPVAMPARLGDGVRWLPGATPWQAARSVRGAGRFDVCHVHMTYAEAVATALRRRHRAPVVATRHFAARRGASVAGRVLAGPIRRGLTAEIAISEYVAAHLERPPARTILNGVGWSPLLWSADSRVVLVLQRLEREKDTDLALRAWGRSGLAAQGWRLRVVGTGALRPHLEAMVRDEALDGVEFAGWVSDVPGELAAAGMVLATAPREPLGLSVLEAMAAGVPVVAAAGGGHVETVGRVQGAAMFPPGDVRAAADELRRLAGDLGRRRTLSSSQRRVQTECFSLEEHVARVVDVYDWVRSERVRTRRPALGTDKR